MDITVGARTFSHREAVDWTIGVVSTHATTAGDLTINRGRQAVFVGTNKAAADLVMNVQRGLEAGINALEQLVAEQADTIARLTGQHAA